MPSPPLAVGDLRVEVAPTWTLRPAGSHAIIAHPSEHATLPLSALPQSVLLILHETVDTISTTAHTTMCHRAPGVLPTTVSCWGDLALAYDWTDGVFEIDTLFSPAGPRRILEATFALRPPHLGGPPLVGPPRHALEPYVQLFPLLQRLRASSTR